MSHPPDLTALHAAFANSGLSVTHISSETKRAVTVRQDSQSILPLGDTRPAVNPPQNLADTLPGERTSRRIILQEMADRSEAPPHAQLGALGNVPPEMLFGILGQVDESDLGRAAALNPRIALALEDRTFKASVVGLAWKLDNMVELSIFEQHLRTMPHRDWDEPLFALAMAAHVRRSLAPGTGMPKLMLQQFKKLRDEIPDRDRGRLNQVPLQLTVGSLVRMDGLASADERQAVEKLMEQPRR